MMYEIIVIGATFTAAGILQKYGDKCLVLERRPQAGYEFLNALKFGYGYDESLKSAEAKDLYEKFAERKAFSDNRICLFDCASILYSLFEGKNVMLNMELLSVEKDDEEFTVTAHGVSGFKTYRAKKVIDTIVHNDMIEKKTLNFLVNSESLKNADIFKTLKTENWGYAGDIAIKCDVDKNSTYAQARQRIKQLSESLPEEYKIAFIADCFDYEVKSGYPIEKDGIFYMPSVAYKNPVQAYDAGISYMAGGVF